MNKIDEQTAAMEIQVLHPLEPYTPDDYTPTPYTPTGNVKRQHALPRFGHTRDFNVLVQGVARGNEEMATNYIVGVVAGSILILCIAVVWFLAIICLKIAGQKRVGFLAGRLVRPEQRPIIKNGSDRTLSAIAEGDEQEQENNENEEEPVANRETEASLSAPLMISNTIFDEREVARKEKKFHRHTVAVRAAFVVSGILVIMNGAFFYGRGVAAFDDSLNSVRSGIGLVQNTAYKVIDLTDNLLKDQDALEQDLAYTRSNFTEGQQFCNATDPLATQIHQIADELSVHVKDLSEYLHNELSNFGNDMRELVKITEEVDQQLDKTDIFFYIMISISVVLITIVIAMMGGAYFAAKDVSNCFTKFVTNVILWPVFTFFLLLMWVFATLFLVGSLAGADFCIQPDQYVAGILKKNQDKFTSILFGFLIYYVSGCTVLPPGEEDVRHTVSLISTVVNSAHDLTDLVQNQTIAELEQACGMEETAANALQSGASLVHSATHTVNYALNDLEEILSCRSFNPIYTTFVHDAFCVQGVDGLTWIFSSALLISVFSMIMIMFRAAIYPIKDSPASSTLI